MSALWETLIILAGLGAATMLAALWLARNRHRLGGLRRQMVICGALIAGQLLAATGLFAALMVVSATDVLFTAIAVLFSCVLGGWVAHLLGARMMSDVEAVAAGLEAIGAGERDIFIATCARDELARLGRQVERTSAALGTAEQARRSLLAAVSHDLRTPLTSIRVLAEAIGDEILDDATCREYGTRLAVHARAFSALIDDLFELSRLEAGDVGWTVHRVEIGGLVQEAIDAMRPEAEAGAVAMRLDLPVTGIAARGNPERIQRVLFNLLVNAIRHTPAQGSVSVRAEPVGDAVEIEVADTGAGIEPAEREAVFEPFVQGAAHASRADGHAGLGLAIARAIVEAHGGRIWLAEATRGTRVRFSLPSAAGTASRAPAARGSRSAASP